MGNYAIEYYAADLAYPDAATIAEAVRTELTAELAEISATATEVGKIPRGTAAVDAGPFTMKVTNGATITGGQSVTAEYE